MQRIKAIGATASFLVFAHVLSAQIITTAAGTGWTFPSASLAATGAPLGQISGVAVDGKGNIYVADPGNYMVMKISNGKLTVVAGNGVAGYSGDGGPATNASLEPTDVAVDSQGNLYIVDASRIRKVNAAGTISTLAGNGILGYAGDNGPATSASLDPYTGIAVDAGGNVYFADTFNNVIRKINPSGNIATIVGAYPGTAGFNGDGQPATKALLDNPYGLALDSAGNLYIADTKNHRVRMVSASNGTINTIFGTSSFIPAGDGLAAVSASLDFPTGLAVDAANNLYVSDEVANNVRMVTFATQVVSTIAGASGNAQPGFSGDNGLPTKATLSSPWGIGVDTSGNVYVADSMNSRLRKVGTGAAATINTIAGNGQFKYAGDGFSAINAQLNSPAGLTFDSNGSMYVADADNNRIRKVNGNGIISTYAGNGLAGSSGDGGSATLASLSNPTGLTVDNGLNLYIADTGNSRIREVTPGGTITTVAGGGTGAFVEGTKAVAAAIGGPTGVAVDSSGNIYIAASTDEKIYRVTTDGLIHTFAGYGSAGLDTQTQATQAALNFPTDVALDSAGNVYIADSHNCLIRKVSPGSGGNNTISTVAGKSCTTAEADGVAATSSGLFFPQAVSVDSSGNLFVAELGGRIREVTAKTGIIQTVAGEGQPNILGDGGNAVNAGINNPEAVALNPSGSLYIADTGNSRIRTVIAAPQANQPPPPIQITFNATPLSLTFTGNNANGPSAPLTVALAATELANGETSSLPGLQYTAAGNAPWLSVTPASGTMPGSLQITANPSGMAAGTYNGLVTITASAASPSTSTVAITFTVTAAIPPTLGVDTQAINLSATQGSSSVSQQIHVLDTGGGTAPFTVTTTASGGTWLSVSISNGTATPSVPVALNVTASPGNLAVGTYSGSITLTGPGTPITVPVTFIVGQSTANMLVSQSGLAFSAVQQGGMPLPETFGILNVGTGSMNWTASATTLSGGNWLQISPTSGTVQRPYLDFSPVVVSINQAGLAPATYYGQIQIASPAPNSPQLLTVILTVFPAGYPLGPQLSPSGLIFTGAYGATPGSQDVMISNPAGTSISFASAVNFTTAVSNLPTNASLCPPTTPPTPCQPATMHVNPNFGSLSAGSVTQGTITLQFSDRSPSQAVNVLMVVAPTGTTPTDAQPVVDSDGRTHADAAEPKASPSCSPLQIQFRSFQGSSFTATVGQGTSIEVQVSDACANLVNSTGPGSASVLASFSQGAPVTLNNTGDGIWQGTWTPMSATTYLMYVTAVNNALLNGKSSTVSAVVNAPAQGAQTPAMSAQSVYQGASFLGGVPIAPGELITVFGSNMASQVTPLGSLPWPLQAGGTQVFLGNQLLPILYSSSGQLNVQVPYSVVVNTQHQLSVQNGTTISIPQSLVVAAAVPGIFTADSSGSGQGSIYDGANLAQPGTPAAIGDTVVIYATGLGAVTGNVVENTPAPSSPLAYTANPVTVMIGGQAGVVSFAGLTPGYAGVYQVNVQIPPGIATGNAVPVFMTVAGQTSATVTMAVQ